mmetsp:Transcript_16111/g.52535  ORF Transcript_16111/g.52535 Transcript_16111/m.52535 type:complete len:202 (+) Transcript_16111:162-767(+)
MRRSICRFVFRASRYARRRAPSAVSAASPRSAAARSTLPTLRSSSLRSSAPPPEPSSSSSSAKTGRVWRRTTCALRRRMSDATSSDDATSGTTTRTMPSAWTRARNARMRWLDESARCASSVAKTTTPALTKMAKKPEARIRSLQAPTVSARLGTGRRVRRHSRNASARSWKSTSTAASGGTMKSTMLKLTTRPICSTMAS